MVAADSLWVCRVYDHSIRAEVIKAWCNVCVNMR